MGFGQESRTTLILLNVCEVRQLSIVFFINTNGYLNLKKREREEHPSLNSTIRQSNLLELEAVLTFGHISGGGRELREVFPNIYRVFCQREMTVQQIRMSHKGVIHWDLRFKRNLQEWEMEEFHKLTEIFSGLDNPANILDAWNWRVSVNGLFIEFLLVREECTFPHDSIRTPRAPRR